MKHICCALVVLVLAATPSSSAQEVPSDPMALQTILALNYCHMSLVKILAYEDRVVLDEEYHTIINNINLTTIHDRELLTILKRLMDTLTDFRLAEQDRAYLQRAYDRRVSALMYTQVSDGAMKLTGPLKAFMLVQMVVKLTKNVLAKNALGEGVGHVLTRSLAGGVIGGPTGAIVGGGTALVSAFFRHATSSGLAPVVALHALSGVGGVYHNYQDNMTVYRETLARKVWALEKETIRSINATRKEFLTVYWELMHAYHIPDAWRLTEQQLAWFLEVVKEEDAERRWRLLETEQEKFTVFPPFWYALARTAFETNRLRESLALYDRISTKHIPFFREDHAFSSALMDKLLLIQTVQETQPALLDEVNIQVDLSRDLARIVQNSPDDWRKNLFAALQYARLQEYEQAKALIVRNLDHQDEISLNSRILGELYALSDDDDRLTELIVRMYDDDQIRYQDTLHLIGKIRDGRLLEETFGTVVSPTLNAIDFRLDSPLLYGDDVLMVRIPDRWGMPASDHVRMSLLPLDEETEYMPVARRRCLLLTEQTVTALQQAGLPRQTLAVLEEDFLYEEYEKEALLSRLTEKIGALPDDTLRLIMKYAHPMTEFQFEGILEKGKLLEQRRSRSIVMRLSDPSQQAAALLFDVAVQDVEVEKTILDKSLEKPGEALETVATFYNSWFADEQEEGSAESPTAKTEPRIVFVMRELKTSDACYHINGQAVSRQTGCSF
ncbi:hypothetical protein GF348_03430 [candidate division KSB3 bacterium]|nr:hypothetical protein [candidate division KSB3 bacterium]